MPEKQFNFVGTSPRLRERSKETSPKFKEKDNFVASGGALLRESYKSLQPREATKPSHQQRQVTSIKSKKTLDPYVVDDSYHEVWDVRNRGSMESLQNPHKSVKQLKSEANRSHLADHRRWLENQSKMQSEISITSTTVDMQKIRDFEKKEAGYKYKSKRQDVQDIIRKKLRNSKNHLLKA